MKPENVGVVIADPDQQAQGAIRMALHALGYRTFYAVATRAEAEQVLSDGPIELLFTEQELGDGPAGPFLRAIRLGALGPDPFLPIIATLAEADPNRVRAIVDDGPDDVLIKPLSTDMIGARIDRIVKNRKPFVVTRDYFGPDRRAKPREDSAAAPAFDVPNRLKAVLENTLEPREMDKAVQAAMAKLMDVRITSQAKAVVFVLDRALPDWMTGVIDAKTPGYLKEMAGLAESALELIEDTRFAEQASAFRALQTAVRDINAGGPEVLGRYLDGLQTINTTLKRAFR